MNAINKVSISRGAEWLLRGFALLGRAPLLLGAAGGLLGLVAGLGLIVSGNNMTGNLVVQLLITVLSPLLLGGLVWTVREVDQGRSPAVGDLMQGLRADKAPSLLALLLPQLLAAAVLFVLLMLLVGKDALLAFVDLVANVEQGRQPTPDDLKDFPAGRFLLWLLLLVGVAMLTAFSTFTAYPQVMFDQRNPLQAIRNSLQACFRNLLAVLLFFILLAIALFAVNIAVMLVGGVVGLVAGERGALLVVQVLTMAVLMPVMAGAFYAAWADMHGTASDASGHDQAVVPPPVNGGSIEV